MTKSHQPYDPEFHWKIVELVRSGKSPADPAKAFGPDPQAIRNWVRQADLDQGRCHDGLKTEECDELTRLRRKVRQWKMERDLLKKRQPVSRRGNLGMIGALIQANQAGAPLQVATMARAQTIARQQSEDSLLKKRVLRTFTGMK